MDYYVFFNGYKFPHDNNNNNNINDNKHDVTTYNFSMEILISNISAAGVIFHHANEQIIKRSDALPGCA